MKAPKVTKNFTKVPNFLFDEGPLGAYERLLLGYILSKRECFAGQHTMAKDLNISRATVQRAIASLLKRNAIGKIHRTGWSYIYVVKPRAEWITENAVA